MVCFVFNFHCWFRLINWFFIVALTFISTGRNLSTFLLGLNIGIDFCKGSTLFWNMLFILQIVFSTFLVYSKLNIFVDKFSPEFSPFALFIKFGAKLGLTTAFTFKYLTVPFKHNLGGLFKHSFKDRGPTKTTFLLVV